MIVRKFIDVLESSNCKYLSMRTELHNLQIKAIFAFVFR